MGTIRRIVSRLIWFGFHVVGRPTARHDDSPGHFCVDVARGWALARRDVLDARTELEITIFDKWSSVDEPDFTWFDDRKRKWRHISHESNEIP